MVKISDLATSEEVHRESMRDPEYAREYERTRFANEVAIRVLKYRVEHNLSQSQLARMIGIRQPNVARLESGEHEPSLSTLSRLATALGLDLSVEIKPGLFRLAHADNSEAGNAVPRQERGKTPSAAV